VATRKTSGWTGKLAEPIRGRRAKHLIDIADEAERDRLAQLLRHYGLAPNDWEGLALALAREFHPAFLRAPPKGRPTKWNARRDMVLAGDVAMFMLHYDCTAREACRWLTETVEWKCFLEPRTTRANAGRDPSAPLWQRYKTMPRELKARGAELWQQLHDEDRLDQWESYGSLALAMED
jgi:hypothetical protein